MIEFRGATITMNILKSCIPLAALIALASVMPFAPRIGPIVLVCAVAAAGLPFLLFWPGAVCRRQSVQSVPL